LLGSLQQLPTQPLDPDTETAEVTLRLVRLCGCVIVCAGCTKGRNGCRTAWNKTYRSTLGEFPNEKSTTAIKEIMNTEQRKRKDVRQPAAASAPPEDRSPLRKKSMASPRDKEEEEANIHLCP
jgi:hypothetical protein